MNVSTEDAELIPGVPGYRVTFCGRVYSVDTNWRRLGIREMCKSPDSNGYPSVRLVVNGQRKRFRVHCLVASVFLPQRPSLLHEIRHLDGNKDNSNATNLAWGTNADNAADREVHGRTSKGSTHSDAIRSGQKALRWKVIASDLLATLERAVSRLEAEIGDDCECDSTHAINDVQCCLCECRSVIQRIKSHP